MTPLCQRVDLGAHLMTGTGKAWARQRRARAEPLDLCTSMSLYSREKVGALAPTGSANEISLNGSLRADTD